MKTTRLLCGVAAASAGLALAGCGLLGDSSPAGGSASAPKVFEGPVPRAACGPGSMPEPGIQGRVPIEDRTSGRYLQPYNCNLEKLGHVGDGASWQMAWYDDCAYYGTAQSGGQGVQVVDASDPANPRITAKLTTAAMLDPWESLKVNEARELLASVGAGAAGPFNFDVYSVAGDCSRPQLEASLPVNGVGHEGNFAPDGRTYYGVGFLSPEIVVLDTENPSTPKPITALPIVSHGVDVSADGNTLYTSLWGGQNGLWIYDVSLINSRTPVAAVRVPAQAPLLGFVAWSDGMVAQQPLPVKIKGKPYVIFIDEAGLGMARIIDVSNPSAPVVVSKLRTEITMPDAAPQREADSAGTFAYDGHYCGVDSREDATAVACSYFWGGIRIFDIRDPASPKEIAYYIPAANPANWENSATSQKGCDSASGPEACTSAQVRFVRERGELWFTNQLDGFTIVKFTNGAWPFKD